MAVQAKREIGKLWDDIEKAPYKTLFNSGLSSVGLWQEVEVLRGVETFVAEKKRVFKERDRLMVTHGNRFLLHLVYGHFGDRIYGDKNLMDGRELEEMCHQIYEKLSAKVNGLYPESLLGSLFKNLSKCRHIKEQL